MKYWDIVDLILRNKLQWTFIRNSYIFIQENAFESGSWIIAAILSRAQCVNLVSGGLFDSWLDAVGRRAMVRPRADRYQRCVILNEQVDKTIYWINQFACLFNCGQQWFDSWLDAVGRRVMVRSRTDWCQCCVMLNEIVQKIGTKNYTISPQIGANNSSSNGNCIYDLQVYQTLACDGLCHRRASIRDHDCHLCLRWDGCSWAWQPGGVWLQLR